MNIEKPLDFLEGKKGKDVLVEIKNSNGLIKGKLIAWDGYINLIIEIKGNKRFIKGDSILWIE